MDENNDLNGNTIQTLTFAPGVTVIFVKGINFNGLRIAPGASITNGTDEEMSFCITGVIDTNLEFNVVSASGETISSEDGAI